MAATRILTKRYIAELRGLNEGKEPEWFINVDDLDH